MSGDGSTFTVAELAAQVIGPGIGAVRAMTKLLNDAGAEPRLDELQDDPAAVVSRGTVCDLFALRAGDRLGRKLADVLRPGMWAKG
jgi:hypothetical protein